jgi:2-polyprenyl-3-methyl-5-hydroxy-6-metoxy-1,4-benzoquinol methylase
MSSLNSRRVTDYFSQSGTVSTWWTPDEGPMRFHYDAELQILRDHLPIDPSWRVLDVGTGSGRFGLHFADAGCRVVGVDLNPEMLGAARERAEQLGLQDRFELRQANAEDLSALGESRFDVVTCMELFDHLPDLDGVLAEIRRILEPGGRFLFTYVPSESLYGALGNAYRWIRSRTHPSELAVSQTWSRAEIQRRLTDNGLRLERYWGVGLLCASAQTRLFQDSALVNALIAIGRAEAKRWPYYERPWLARHGAHVVGLARSPGATAS